MTIGLWIDGVRKILSGCAGSFVVTLPTGNPGYIDWTFLGITQDETDEAIIAPTYPTAKPMRFAGGLAEWNDVNLCVSTATINSGNNVILRECPTTEAGFISAIITDRRPTISVDPEAATVAAQARWTAWLASTEYALELDVGGPGNSVLSFDAPKASLLNKQEGDRNGIVIDQLEFQANKNGANNDQELSITFTAAT